VLRRGLLENGYDELAISGAHAVAVLSLPPLHKDPFDRMLVAQATVEGVVLLTATPRSLNIRPGPESVIASAIPCLSGVWRSSLLSDPLKISFLTARWGRLAGPRPQARCEPLSLAFDVSHR